jgi:glycerol-3-phosphate acyltransferase PlsY
MASTGAQPVHHARWPHRPLLWLVAGLVVAALILWRHRGNIRRLVAGTENKV